MGVLRLAACVAVWSLGVGCVYVLTALVLRMALQAPDGVDLIVGLFLVYMLGSLGLTSSVLALRDVASRVRRRR